MNRVVVACLAALAFSYAMPCAAPVDLAFPQRPERGVKLPGLGDDEADPRSCIDTATKNAAKGMPVEFTVLPGTTHAFDHSWMGDKPVVSRQAGRTGRLGGAGTR